MTRDQYTPNNITGEQDEIEETTDLPETSDISDNTLNESVLSGGDIADDEWEADDEDALVEGAPEFESFDDE